MHLGHEELDARNAEQRIQELLTHALEQVGAAHMSQIQVAQYSPPYCRRKYVQHLPIHNSLTKQQNFVQLPPCLCRNNDA